MATITIDLPHRARYAARLTVDLPHRGSAGSRLTVDLPHTADSSMRLRVDLPHSTPVGQRLTVELPHSVTVSEQPEPIRILPLGPDMGPSYVPVDPGSVSGLFNINLLTGFFKPWVKVHGPVSGKKSSVDIGSRINGGWNGNVTYLGLKELEFDEDAEFRIEMCDGAGGYSLSPPMVAEQRKQSESFSGPVTSYSLMDRTSYRLSQTGRSLPTFVRTNASAVVAAIQAEWLVQISGAPNFAILEEDIKDSSGWDALLRYAAVAGMDLVIGPDGRMRFVDCWQQSGSIRFRVQSLDREYTPSLAYTGFSAVKTSTMAPAGPQMYQFTQQGFASFQLKAPLRNVSPGNRSVRGGLAYLSLFNGPPGDPGSKLVEMHLLGAGQVNIAVPVYQGLVVTHATVAVLPNTQNQAPVDARLVLNGSPPEPPHPGTEPAFVVQHNPNAGRRTQIWREQTLPNKAYCLARVPRYLWQASKRARPLSYRGRCDLRMAPLVGLQRAGHGRNKAEEVRHSFKAGAVPETSVSAVYLP